LEKGEKVTAIALNKQLYEKSSKLRLNVRKFRAAFMLFVVILHELAHVKIRNYGAGYSPEKAFKVDGLGGVDSGFWLETNLFGAKMDITPVTFTKPVVAWAGGKDFPVDDKWIQRFVKRMIKDKIEDEEEFKIPRPKGIQKGRRGIRNRPLPDRRSGWETVNGVVYRL